MATGGGGGVDAYVTGTKNDYYGIIDSLALLENKINSATNTHFIFLNDVKLTYPLFSSFSASSGSNTLEVTSETDILSGRTYLNITDDDDGTITTTELDYEALDDLQYSISITRPEGHTSGSSSASISSYTVIVTAYESGVSTTSTHIMPSQSGVCNALIKVTTTDLSNTATQSIYDVTATDDYEGSVYAESSYYEEAYNFPEKIAAEKTAIEVTSDDISGSSIISEKRLFFGRINTEGTGSPAYFGPTSLPADGGFESLSVIPAYGQLSYGFDGYHSYAEIDYDLTVSYASIFKTDFTNA